MSVYKKKGRETYWYDFWLQGRRFSGDARTKNKREAERLEESLKEWAREQLRQEAAFVGEEMSFEIASSRWWHEVGTFNSPKNHTNILRDLAWLTTAIGADRNLTEIDDRLVAAVVAKRRGEYRRGQKKLGLISESTVNRTCTERLREIILRARDVWKVKTAEVNFGKHMLDEPEERVREATVAEEEAIMAQLSPGYDVAVEFAFLSGCRRMEIIGLEWPHVDFFSQRFIVTGKGGKQRSVPMTKEIFELLWSQKDHHATKVFTYVCRRTKKKEGLVKGQRYPLTESGLKTAMRRAVPAASVVNFRFHDTRHTAATRILRESNLRVVQKLLGHSKVETTAKYAHAMDDDIRNAMEAAQSTSNLKRKQIRTEQ